MDHWRNFVRKDFSIYGIKMSQWVLISMTFIIIVQLYEFHKRPIPEDSEEKKTFVTSLMEFGVSVKQYNDAFAMKNITMHRRRNRGGQGGPGPPTF